MNRVTCINCQTTWPSLPYDQLEEQHTCPVCGDQLGSLAAIAYQGEDGGTLPPAVHFEQAA